MNDFKNLNFASNKEDKKQSVLENNSACCDSGSENDCCDPNDSDCGCGSVSAKKQTIEVGKAIIDGIEVAVESTDTNLVELAKKAKIGIPAPCYLAKKKNGCCMACVVEVNGRQEYACGTTPQNGMNVIVNRNDLKQIRKERLLKYQEGIKTDKSQSCSE